MRTFLLWLALGATPALGSPLYQVISAHDFPPISFDTELCAITDYNTPEWAKLADAFAWYELILGTWDSGSNPITLVLRGVLKSNPNANPDYSLVQWMELIPQLSGLNDPPSSNNPEPGTMALLATTLLALIGAKMRKLNR